MDQHEKRRIRGFSKGMRLAYPESYRINKRIDRHTDPLELKVRELFEIHIMFASHGWRCLEGHDDKFTHYRGEGSKQNSKVYTEEQMLRVISKHFARTMTAIRKLESEHAKQTV